MADISQHRCPIVTQNVTWTIDTLLATPSTPTSHFSESRNQKRAHHEIQVPKKTALHPLILGVWFWILSDTRRRWGPRRRRIRPRRSPWSLFQSKKKQSITPPRHALRVNNPLQIKAEKFVIIIMWAATFCLLPAITAICSWKCRIRNAVLANVTSRVRPCDHL